MKKQKLNLNNVRVSSFRTSIEADALRGGGLSDESCNIEKCLAGATAPNEPGCPNTDLIQCPGDFTTPPICILTAPPICG